MYVKYGNYQHAANEVALNGISREGLTGDNGIQWAVRTRFDLVGRLQAESSGALTAAILAMEAAYLDGQGDFGLYHDNGTPTAHCLVAAQTAGGIRCTRPVSYPVGNGAEYVLMRNYTVSVEADVITYSANIREWTESVSFSGGGPVFGFLDPINGPPQLQLFKQQSTFKATQRGRATGNVAVVMPPPPLWPAAEHQHQRQYEESTGQRRGVPGQPVYTGFPNSWAYFFESAVPLFGLPTVQPEN